MIIGMWFRSSRCESFHCAEVSFRKSSHCESANCAEVAAGDVVLLRDSKDPDGPVLEFGAGAWRRFLAGLRG